MQTSGNYRHWRWLSLILVGGAAAAAFWPGLRSFFVLDDFFLTAISRLVGNPWTFFPHSHMPGSFFYRPLTMQLWWLSVELFGNAPGPHYLLNLLLHIGVSLALWRVLLNWTKTRGLALLGATAFAAHPIAIGTALGLSDRFDLLAALLGLLAIDATWRYRRSASRSALCTLFVCAALAPFAKEIGFASYAAMVVILLWPEPDNPTRQWPMRRIACLLIVLALGLLGWRKFVLGDALEPHLLLGASIIQVAFEGLWHWLERLFVFVLDLPRLSLVARSAVLLGSASFVLWIMFGLLRYRGRAWRSDNLVLVIAALGLMMATGVLQAPTLRFMPLTGIANDGQSMATDSRMFYLSLIGLTMLLAGLAAIALRALSPMTGLRRAAPLAAVVLCAVPWFGDANRLASQYRRQSHTQGQFIQAAVAAVSKLPPPASRCQVYFLDLPAESSALFAITVDSAIKALSLDVSRVAGCLFQTQFTPSYYILARGALPLGDRAPLSPLFQDGKPVRSLNYGGVEVAYLNLSSAVDAKTLSGAVFLSFVRTPDGSATFVDVTPDVLGGRREVKFRCDRAPQQCAPSAAQPEPQAGNPG
jgi:hypothetical protein